jgi:hypothetical protein
LTAEAAAELDSSSPTLSTSDSISGSSSSSSGTGSSSSGGNGSETGSWLSRFIKGIFNIIKSITKVGQVLVGFSVADTTQEVICQDSDAGKDYYIKGTGSGLFSGTEILFEDLCYKGSQENEVAKCAGTDCFLVEYICDEENVNSESNVRCPYGCSNGACIPDPSLNDRCTVFDRDTFKWKNIC